MVRFFRFVLICLAILTLAKIDNAAGAEPQKASSPPKSNASGKSAELSPPISGKVVETMNSGSYTYVCLEKNGKKTWVAIPEMKVSIGQELSLPPGLEMSNFTSKPLGRTFETIIFSQGPASPPQAGGGEMLAGHGTKGAPAGGSMGAVAPPLKNIKVPKATGSDAYTVGEVFEKRAALHKKTVVVKGQVVKVSVGIMGKNWVHLQDGSGDPKKKTHDLVATTSELPAVGNVITVRGSIFKDKDFGSGYHYVVIMEEASIQR
jgi:hypothetical protein